MTSAYDAFYFHTFPSTDLELAQGVKWLLERSRSEDGTPLVVAPTRRHFKDHDALEVAAKFAAAETPQTLARMAWRGGPVLAAWPNQDTLDRIDGLTWPITSLCVVPWMRDDVETWLRARRPVDLAGRAEQRPVPTIADPVVAVALEHLTIRVNLGTGLGHPSDKATAVQTFRALRKGGHTWSSDEVYAWALNRGWRAGDARELASLAEKIAQGRSVHGGKAPMLHRDAVKRWREEAREQDSS